MIKEDILPYPRNPNAVYNHLADIVIANKSKLWKGKILDVQPFFNDYKNILITPDDELYVQFNCHLIYRSSTQMNEACNKLWATAELYYHLMNGGSRLCNDFNSGFLPGSTVGTLYYAAMSSLIGILTLFGVCPIREKNKNYNIIRTSKGFMIQKREEYLKSIFGTCPNGWHEQFLLMYSEFHKHGLDLPPIDIKDIYLLKSDRVYFDYGILAKPTMKNTFGEDHYFKHLRKVVDMLEIGINCLKNVDEPIENGCDKRFNSLKKSLPNLFEKYE
ncbi:MAG: hypothetical protein IBX40_12335 [Methanosarcinales archaeon]|nr:hypothetical protein [Methanosarcinales archaeon]